jgi:hypothetical protein
LLKRERLQQQALGALHRLAQLHEKNGDISGAVPLVWRQLEMEPWSEEAHRYLMRLLALRGQRSAALAQYEACQRALAEELDVKPSIETTQLYEKIRAGEITPLYATQETSHAIAIQEPKALSEPPVTTPITKVIKRTIRLPRWTKIVTACLLMLCIILVVVLFVVRHNIPEATTASVNGKIAVPCTLPASRQICIADAQTGQLTPLVDVLQVDRIETGLSWSPDGQHIVFSASVDNDQGLIGEHDLYQIDADGSNLQQITNGTANDILPSWSPDGAWIAFHRDCNLWLIHPDGTQPEPLSFDLCVGGIAWSPDSQWIAFIDLSRGPDEQRPTTIRVFRHGGSESRIIYTLSQPIEGGRLAWSPDGQQIFATYNVEGKFGGIY